MEEKKSIKVSLGTVVCLFIIVLLIIGLACMYLYYNKNNSNIIVGKNYGFKTGEKELYKTSDFESIYTALVDSEYNNLKSFVTSDNKIKEIRVSGITIYTEDYLNATGIKPIEYNSEDKVMGSCVFTVEFENIEGLALAGNKGNIHAIVGKCLTDEKEFIFDRSTNKIELNTSLYEDWRNNDKNSKNNIELNTSIWLTPLTKYTIDNTDNTFEITHDIAFPTITSGEMLSWSQTIDYIITCDGIEYHGSTIFDSDFGISNNGDNNPRYNIELIDYKDNSVFVKITKK